VVGNQPLGNQPNIINPQSVVGNQPLGNQPKIKRNQPDHQSHFFILGNQLYGELSPIFGIVTPTNRSVITVMLGIINDYSSAIRPFLKSSSLWLAP
jgi:hypothetical protein